MNLVVGGETGRGRGGGDVGEVVGGVKSGASFEIATALLYSALTLLESILIF